MKKVFYGFLILLWMAVIFYFSNQTATSSTETTINLIKKFSLLSGLENITDMIIILFMPIRKLAHLLIYFILAILICNFLKEFPLKYKELFIICLFSCVIYALSDEVHQTFVSGRSGNVLDVFIDSIGSIIGLFLYTKIKKLYQ